MRASTLLISALALTTSLIPVAHAARQDNIPVVQIPDQYLISTAPAGISGLQRPATAATAAAAVKPAQSAVEKPSSLNGTLYAVVAPTYNGSNGSVSFLRLFNGGAVATTFSITVVGSPSGKTYGTTNISVPRNGSPQFPITSAGGSNSIVSQANAAALNGGDTSYSLYIQNPEPTAGYQHVTFNGSTALFENASDCAYLLNQAITSVSNSLVMTNIHTSLLAAKGYPSTIDIANYWNAMSSYLVTVIDSDTGVIEGQVTVQVPANSTYEMPFTFFQNAANWTAATSGSDTQDYANMIFTDTSGAAPTEMVAQAIQNNVLGGSINMTTACAVNAPVSSSSTSTGGGLNGY